MVNAARGLTASGRATPATRFAGQIPAVQKPIAAANL